MDPTSLQHLLILCCYGGVPFIDYSKPGLEKVDHHFSLPLDPTDWIAVDSSGSLLNDTIHPEILKQNPSLANLIPPDTSLDQCDLYNLTFSSTADERVFELGQGHLSCRCPVSRTGVACHLHKFEPAPLIEVQKMSGDPFSAYVIFTLFFMIAMVAVFMMMRGCFCDFLGGCRNPFKKPKDEPLDPVAISRCLQAVQDYQNKKNITEANRPLISSISEGCAPYNDTVFRPPPSAPIRRSCSPPPSYRSEHGSTEFLPGVVASNTQL
ncbi:hypothetical protein FO519_003696 [Halicephalobus sp. NKZ332]|nr:hypothetical protein FO519_003696 [Halicephalobus sp. NKZ332]